MQNTRQHGSLTKCMCCMNISVFLSEYICDVRLIFIRVSYCCIVCYIILHVHVSVQYAEMQQSAGRYGDDVKSSKAEIADMNRRIMRLQSEIDMAKSQVRKIE